MADGPDHLVAVIGLGVSSVPTADGARILSDNGIPMVGAVTTADDLNSDGSPAIGGRLPGLTRVNSGVGVQFAVVAAYLKEHRPELRTAMLVNDSNPVDLYTSSMRTDFSGKGQPLATYWQRGGRVVQPYDGAPDSPGVGAQFDAIVSNFCGVDPPDMVFYAGRAVLLPSFIERLRQRKCLRDRTITVVTGPDASSLTNTLSIPDELDAPVSVIYAPQSYPGALRDRTWNPDAAQYLKFEDSFTKDMGFPTKDLADGWAIATHDAMLAAARAVGRAAGQADVLPSKTDVRGVLYTLNSPTTSIPGAGGTFMFHPTSGDAVGRRIPVMELRPDGKLGVLEVYPQPIRR